MALLLCKSASFISRYSSEFFEFSNSHLLYSLASQSPKPKMWQLLKCPSYSVIPSPALPEELIYFRYFYLFLCRWLFNQHIQLWSLFQAQVSHFYTDLEIWPYFGSMSDLITWLITLSQTSYVCDFFVSVFPYPSLFNVSSYFFYGFLSSSHPVSSQAPCSLCLFVFHVCPFSLLIYTLHASF